MCSPKWCQGVLCLALLSATCSILSAEAPFQVRAGEPQLFIDDLLVQSRQNVERRLHAAQRTESPVVRADRPWEGVRVNIFGTVLRDSGGLYRMWYNGAPYRDMAPEMKTLRDSVLYATSKDGLHWEKPTLGIYEWQGSRANNIVYNVHSPSVILDQRETDPAKRYKMLGTSVAAHRGLPESAQGYWAAYSADGLHWKEYPINPVLLHTDTITLMQHPRTGEYMAFHKRPGVVRGTDRRLIWLSVSKDFQHWSEPKLILPPDAEDDRFAKNPGQRMEFYNMSAIPYGSHFLGFITAFHMSRRVHASGPDQSPDDGPVDLQLTYSDDGYNWRRYEDRSPVLAVGPKGSFDGGMILGVANALVPDGDRVHLYYTGYNVTHGAPMKGKTADIGRASWRVDGFVSLDAGPTEGTVTTQPLRLNGKGLAINAEAGDGQVLVEVLDAEQRPLPGYTRAGCVPLHSNATSQPVRWATLDTLPAGKVVRLRFHLKNARIYSFRVSK